ncbi:MAG: glycosyltransferase family 2 protein [Breznakibacter sp.]
MDKTKVSLFLTTYNWPDALGLCLQSIREQTVMPDEVIVADDGSDDATREVVEHFKQSFPVPIVHCRHEHSGYRINAVRNMAIRHANHPYIIQLDGDLILDKDFVADHLEFASLGRFVIGRRKNISKEQTEEFCEKLRYRLPRQFRNKTIAVWHHHLLYGPSSVKGVRGCNVAFWKEDAYRVNGYDEEMTSKGPNDKEFCARLVHAGVKGYNLKFYANAYHLHHGENGLRTNYEHVSGIYQHTLSTKKVRCGKGLDYIS